MRKLFSINRNLATILFTLFIVILLGAIYRFVYIPGREQTTQENHFRALQRIDTNIEEKFENINGMLSNLLEPYVDTTTDGVKSKKRDSILVKEYIAGNNQMYGWKNFTIDNVKKYSIRDLEDKNINAYITLCKNNKREYREIYVDSVVNSFTITMMRKNGDSCYAVSLNTSFKQFFAPVFISGIFDQYIIFSNANPVYESFPSGVTYSNNDSLVKTNKEIQSSVVRDINIGGVKYAMFLQSMHLDATHNWVIAGLLKSARFSAETKKLPTGIILLLVTVAIIIIVVFPWLKLFQMGRSNLLTLGDAAFSIMVSILLMSLLFFVFFRYNSFFRQIQDEKKNTAEVRLAQQISDAFVFELNLRYNHLSLLDSIMALGNKSVSKDKYANNIKSAAQAFKGFDSLEIRNNKSPVIRNVDTTVNTLGQFYQLKDSVARIRMSVNRLVDTVFKKPAFEKMFWVDKSARERFYWTNNDYSEPHIYNLWRRDYFKSIQLGKPYFLNNEPEKPFYVDQIISRVDGLFRSAISKQSLVKDDSLKVAVLGFNMQSLSRVLMPAGYSFAITDFNGKVLYFSDSARNLNENLLEEFSAAGNLKRIFISHTAESFRTDYYDKKYKVYAQPITDYLPYYIVILSDTVFKSTRDFEVFSFTVSMLFFFFLLVVFQIIIVMLATYKNLQIPTKHFITHWLWPKKESHTDYNTVAIANALIILLLVSMFNYLTFFDCFLGIIIGLTVSVFLPVFLAAGQQNRKLIYKLSECFIFFIIVTNIIAYKLLDTSSGVPVFVIIELGIILIGVLAYYGGLKFKDAHAGNTKWNYIQSYTLMNCTRLIITSGIPVALFYVTSFNYEQGILTRYRQLDFADQLIKRSPRILLTKIPGDIPGLFDFCMSKDSGMTKTPIRQDLNVKFKNGIYYDGHWISGIGLSDVIENPDSSLQNNLTINLLNLFRYYKNNESDAERNLNYGESEDRLFRYNDSLILRPEHKFVNSTFYRQLTTDSTFLVIDSLPRLYHFPAFSSFNGMVFWIIFALALFSFYEVMLVISKKLFAYALKEVPQQNLLKAILSGEKGLTQSLFVVDLAERSFRDVFFEAIRNKNIFLDDDNADGEQNKVIETVLIEEEVIVVDFMSLPDSKSNQLKKWEWQRMTEEILQKRYRCILIKNAGFNLSNPVSAYERVSFLEGLALNKIIVIITSPVHPEHLVQTPLPSPADVSEEKGIKKLKEYTLRLQSLFKQYKLVYHPLKQTKNIGALNSERMPSYQCIWDALSDGEKFILYDLSKDGLVNVHDDTSIHMLISKGIINCDENKRLIFYDWYFKAFVLKIMSGRGVSVIQSHIEDNGNWNKLRVPLMIVICAVLILLFISQEGAFSKFIGFVGAFATGIPAIMKLFTMFEKTDKKV